MRARILSSLLALSALGPAATVHAQDAAEAEQTTDGQEGTAEEAGDGETEAAEVVDPTQPRTPPNAQGRVAVPGQVHTVARGDTLWDLSQQYLGTPWYWPKVWSYNPEIANPHWIYPGNLVRFFPAGEEGPSRVDVGDAREGVAASEGAPVDLEAPIQLDSVDGEDLVQVTGKIGFEPQNGKRVVHGGFVTGRELDEAGSIHSSFSEALMLSNPDKVYVKFKNRSAAKVGDRYVVFRTEGEIRHPVTGAKVGFLTKFLGTLRVVALSDKFVTAQIHETWDEITRGALVGPFGERLAETVTPRPNAREVRGYVVTALIPALTIYGEHNEVILDKGSADGVEVGNTFTVVRQQDLGGNFMDPSKGQNKDLPVEDVAVCLAVDVKEKTTNCLLTRSIREVVPGDRVEMRVGGGPRTALR